ncbi:hypothetical protein GN958_ATG07544 [Phytophthora infestans]|uniref:Uncharacterized protein n=1 Tax=Phytophthora infestans TaxID=4787 RepID=A0A8S9UQS9_PHYIN|nr:hypothetical protein GN958_ATG07544 [Phytophthora infestans]
MKHTIGFLIGTATPPAPKDIVYVLSDTMERVYDPQDRRTKEALLATASISAQKARVKTPDRPGAGWEANVEKQTCGCRVFVKAGCYIHLVYGLSVRDRLDFFGGARLVYRGRNKSRRLESESQGAGRPVGNSSALQLD